MTTRFDNIGIIGAGQMGNGIAHVCALTGHDVHMVDISEDQLGRALGTIESNMRRQASRGVIADDDITGALGRIHTATDYSAFADCGLVIEAAAEDEQVKKGIFKDLCPALSEDTIIASNTSSISITRLAAQTDRPGKFLGMHFMNPVPVMELIELIRGIATDADTYEAMSHPRPDRKARATYDALKEIVDRRNYQFDRRIIKALISIVSIFPLGILVQLSNGEVGRVVRVSRNFPTRPSVEIILDPQGKTVNYTRFVVLENEPLLTIVDPAIPEDVLRR